MCAHRQEEHAETWFRMDSTKRFWHVVGEAEKSGNQSDSVQGIVTR